MPSWIGSAAGDGERRLGLTYDTGVLVAAERGVRGVWARHQRALLRGWLPRVPAPVLAQAWRGGPQAELSRFLRGCEILPFDEGLARETGRACARARTADVIDACVVVVALGRGDAVVTSDADDLRRIAVALRRRLDVLEV